MFASVRLFSLLLRQRWGLLLIGIVMLGGGLIWGATSHGVTYTNSQSVAYRIAMGSQSGNVYIHADGSSDYFSAFKGDFSPEITQSDIDNSNTLSFVARTDTSTLNPPLNASDGSTVNDAHKIEKLVFYDKNGNVQKTFTTAEYDANPNGFFDNEWLKAIWLVIAGVLVAGASLFFLVLGKKAPANAGFSISAPGALPYQQPYPQQPVQQPNPYGQAANPYGQEYQGPGQYPQATPPYPPQAPGQYPPAAPYPPQAPVYGQPPYQQPPQE